MSWHDGIVHFFVATKKRTKEIAIFRGRYGRSVLQIFANHVQPAELASLKQASAEIWIREILQNQTLSMRYEESSYRLLVFCSCWVSLFFVGFGYGVTILFFWI